MIPFNIPPVVSGAKKYISKAIDNRKICGDGNFTKLCSEWIENSTGTKKCLLTTSCSSALDMTAILCNIKPGDEVIMSSYTFVSTANAFVLRGAKIIFIDIRPDTMNLDETLIESAITKRTRAIVPMHYAGVACEMDIINKIARKYNLFVVEDAAQAIMSTYKNKPLGTLSDFGCFSFHETKNFSSGEGGALLIKNKKYIESAEIIREKGTNRTQFWKGLVDKYTWVGIGSSYLPSELNAAYLYSQLLVADKIYSSRMNLWERYYRGLAPLEKAKAIELPTIPPKCKHNAHMFYLKCKDREERSKLIKFLKKHEVVAVFHYIPLHSSPAGIKYGKFHGEDKYTTKESERLLRLPMYYGLKHTQVRYIISKIREFYAARLKSSNL